MGARYNDFRPSADPAKGDPTERGASSKRCRDMCCTELVRGSKRSLYRLPGNKLALGKAPTVAQLAGHLRRAGPGRAAGGGGGRRHGHAGC